MDTRMAAWARTTSPNMRQCRGDFRGCACIPTTNMCDKPQAYNLNGCGGILEPTQPSPAAGTTSRTATASPSRALQLCPFGAGIRFKSDRRWAYIYCKGIATSSGQYDNTLSLSAIGVRRGAR